MKFSHILIGVLALVCSIQAGPQTFILNGINSNVNPHHVHIYYLNAQNYGFFGGGAIISPNHILTAAHMIVNFNLWDIGVGSNNLNQLNRFTSNVAIAHPQYVIATRVFDIGIITLPQNLTISANVSPAPLPPPGSSILPFANEEGRSYGFGWSAPAGTASSVLQTTFQRVTTQAVCALSYIAVEASQFCASDNTHFSNLCFGDLGGGLYIQYFGVNTLFGIASMVNGECSLAHPTAYARVTAARPWIQQIAQV